MSGTTDPGRLDRRFMGRDFKNTLEKVSPTLQPEETPSFPVPSPPESKAGFVLKGVQFQGNTVFSDDVLTPLLSKDIGQSIGLDRLKAMALTIESYYRTNGYILTRVILPAQDVKDGRVTFSVIEGYIARVELDATESIGAKDWFGVLEEVRGKILALKPLHGPTLESYLLRVNDLSNVKVSGTLEPFPADQPAEQGAVMLRLTATKDASISGELMLDNAGSRFNGPAQGTGLLYYRGLLNSFDQLNLAYLSSIPGDEQTYIRAKYALPLSSGGTTLEMYGSTSVSKPGHTLDILDIDGRSHTVGAEISYPLIRSRSTLFSLAAGFEMKNIDTDLLATNLYTDKTRTLRLHGTVYHADTWGGINGGFIEFRQGVDVFGARETGSQELSRAEGQSDYTSILFTARRGQRLFDNWQLNLAITGQYAFSPLLSSEEFGFGGINFGRAYDPSEMTGDRGIAGSLELRYTGFNLQGGLSLQPFAFYDIGKVWNLDGDGDQESAASAGLGLSLLHRSGLSGSVVAAVPLTRAADNPPGYGNGESARYIFNLKYSF